MAIQAQTRSFPNEFERVRSSPMARAKLDALPENPSVGQRFVFRLVNDYGCDTLSGVQRLFDGVAYSTVQAWWHGKSDPDTKQFTRAVEALRARGVGVEVADLVSEVEGDRLRRDTEGMDPEKAAAIQFATGLYDDRAIAEVLGQDLGGGRGRSRKFWLAMIEARHDELQKDAADPSRVARRLADSAAETARVLAEDNAAKARAAKMVETEKAKRPKKP